MTTIIDRLLIKLQLDPTSVTAQRKKAGAEFMKGNEAFHKNQMEATDSLGKFGETLAVIYKRALGLAAFALGGVSAAKFFENSANEVSLLTFLAIQLDTSIEMLAAWSDAEKRLGGSGRDILRVMENLKSDLQLFMVTRSSAVIPVLRSLFKEDGSPAVLVTDANGILRSIEAIMLDLSDWAISQPNQDAAKAVLRRLGFDDRSALLLFDKSLRDKLAASQKLNLISGENAEQVRELNEAWAKAKQSVVAMGTRIALVMLPWMNDVLKWFESVIAFIRAHPGRSWGTILGAIVGGAIGGIPGAILGGLGGGSIGAAVSKRFGSPPSMPSYNPPVAPLQPALSDLSYGKVRLSDGRGFSGKGSLAGINASPWLVDVMRKASRYLPDGYRATVISSVDHRPRSTSYHPSGRAIDIQIYDNNGKPVPNIGSGPQYKIYSDMALAAKKIQLRDYPDKNFIWGGHFNSGVPYDLMHFQDDGVAARNFPAADLAAPLPPLPDGDSSVWDKGTSAIPLLRQPQTANQKHSSVKYNIRDVNFHIKTTDPTMHATVVKKTLTEALA